MNLKDRKKYVGDLWQEYEPYIRKLCTYKLQCLPDYIDDCIQDVFVDLSDALDKGKTIEYPKAWLTRVANNKIKDIYTRVKKDSQRFVSIESTNFNNEYAAVVYDNLFELDNDQITILKEKVINLLDENEKQLLYEKYSLNKSISQIAKEQNTTKNNIYQKIFRLKTKTKMLIDKILNE